MTRPTWILACTASAIDEIFRSATGINPVFGSLLVEHLSYTHLELLTGIDDPLKRAFYEIESIQGNWSVRERKRRIGYEVLRGNRLKTYNVSVRTQVVNETVFVNINAPQLGVFGLRAFPNTAMLITETEPAGLLSQAIAEGNLT